ncbi:MAG TPA: prolyl oligopeptidase family serine peptidase [Chryseolinea sp.]
MSRWCFVLLLLPVILKAQSLEELTVEKIMRHPKWIGIAPNNIFWSPDSKTLNFYWNPEGALSDSLYSITVQNPAPHKLTLAERRTTPARYGRCNRANTQMTYEKNGDIFLYDISSKKISQITSTIAQEFGPYFSGDERKIIFNVGHDAYSWELSTGKFAQLTNFEKGSKPAPVVSEQEKWLKKDQLAHFEVLKERDTKHELKRKNKRAEQPKKPKVIYLDDKLVEMVQVSPDEKFVLYEIAKNTNPKKAIVPNYVTTSGFTEDINTRTKVGEPVASSELYIYDIAGDTVFNVNTDNIPGIADALPFKKENSKSRKIEPRPINFSVINWSDNGAYCVVIIRSLDFKDCWIMRLDPSTQKLSLLDRQHDDAWVGGPTTKGFGEISPMGWLPDNKRIWFTSEETGYSHLYTIDVTTGKKQALTNGKFEVQHVKLCNSKKYFYLITNEVHPGEKHLYRLASNGGKLERLTSMTGAHEAEVSPDEKTIAFRYSYSNKPWELFIMENKPGATAKQITNSLTKEFTSYPWRDPEVITFKARDNADVYGRIYKPAQPNGAAVVFVHGAGYLQNAHKWWSNYYKEYMFHNLLADKGYTVLDIDYRASSGYGRDWRTGIYRHMGGKDLTDHLDAAKLLVDEYGIDAKRIGIYGGSYGGFITLMAMFTAPDVFAAGAALRPVTDWAHYNHAYTGCILNMPYEDSVAYARSSPIYFAEGLKGALLICHGMVDTNVHFQDVVRLSQRLIELGKDNWELAVYPMEDHGFVEPSSWTDEYKRILKLFEENLKQRKTP